VWRQMSKQNFARRCRERNLFWPAMACANDAFRPERFALMGLRRRDA
jgi:hypothetical protein